MEYIQIGKIVNAVALRGEVKVYHYSDYKERFEELSEILVLRKKQYVSYQIEKVRYQKGMVILKLEGVDDRGSAEALKECDVFITEADLRVLPEDTFYVRDLIGCTVVDLVKCDHGAMDTAVIGRITDVIQNTAQDIYQIETTDGREVLIPAGGDFIKEVDIENRCIKVQLIPGFLD